MSRINHMQFSLIDCDGYFHMMWPDEMSLADLAMVREVVALQLNSIERWATKRETARHGPSVEPVQTVTGSSQETRPSDVKKDSA